MFLTTNSVLNARHPAVSRLGVSAKSIFPRKEALDQPRLPFDKRLYPILVH